jgi:outer membrane protein TolC
MKQLLLLLFILPGLHAGSGTLQSYLSAVRSSNAAASIQAQTAAQAAKQGAQVQTEGILLNGELGYAADKESDRDALEYHLSFEKRLFLGDSDAYIDALKLSAEKQQTLKLNQLKTLVYEQYVSACTLQEKAGLLKDAQDRNIELTRLIGEGVKGGEFDRSALLRSELVVDELRLRIRELESGYFETIQMLRLYTGSTEEPLCQDLSFEITSQEGLEADALLYRSLESEIATMGALKAFHSTAVSELTLGIGYDNEMDLSRATLFMQIPLTQGSRRQSERQSAAQMKLAAQEKLLFAKAQIRAQLRSYAAAQENRQNTYVRLNDILIPTAYETSSLLLERFMGSEGSYLAYIDSQKALFDLLIKSIDIRAETLLAQARLYRTLGIDPQKDIK